MASQVIKKIGIVAIVALAGIQLIRPSKNATDTTPENSILVAYPMPDSVSMILKRSCFDCHSSHTVYPWYANLQPVAWWLNDHITEGKEELNFSEYATYTTKRKLKKLKEIVKEVEEGEMPLPSYTLIHKDAKLTEQEKLLLVTWAKSLSQKISLEEQTP